MKTSPHGLDFEDACRDLWPRHHGTAGRRSRGHAAGSLHGPWPSPPKSARPWSGGHGRPPSRPGWPGGGSAFASGRRGPRKPRGPRLWASNGAWGAKGPHGFSPSVERAWLTPPAAGLRALFPPEVARPVVRLACACPALLGRSRALWEGAARAPPLLTEAIVADLSAAPGRRILAAHHLKPWRHQLRRHPQPPRAAACYATITALIARSTRPRREEERGLAVDRRPRGRRGLAQLRRGPPGPTPGPTAWSRKTRGLAPGSGLPPGLRGRVRSLGRVMTATARRRASPLWHR